MTDHTITPKKFIRKRSKKEHKILEAAEISKWTDKDHERGEMRRTKDRIELLQMDWAIRYTTLSVRRYLMDVKGYSDKGYEEIIKVAPTQIWKDRLKEYQDALTAQVTKRHIDQIADTNDTHIKASKLGVAKIIERLAKGVKVYHKKDGKLKEIGTRECYPKELNDLTNALKTAQSVFRTAVGLPNDGEGSIQILEKIQAERMQVNIQVNTDGTKKEESSFISNVKNMAYDDLMTLVEMKRKTIVKEEE